MPCSCVDCPTCPVIKLEINSDNGFKIGMFNGYGVVAAILIVVLSVTFPFVNIPYKLLVIRCRKKKGMDEFPLSDRSMLAFAKVLFNISHVYVSS